MIEIQEHKQTRTTTHTHTHTHKPSMCLHVPTACLTFSICWTYHSLLSAPLNHGLRAWLHSQLMPVWSTLTERVMTSALPVCVCVCLGVHICRHVLLCTYISLSVCVYFCTFMHGNVLVCLPITVGACMRMLAVCVCRVSLQGVVNQFRLNWERHMWLCIECLFKGILLSLASFITNVICLQSGRRSFWLFHRTVISDGPKD